MKAVVFTLGCKVNSSESASLIHGLQERGYEVTDELVYADIYILNTCAVTSEAEKKSRQAIARIRAINTQAQIFVCGCATEHDPDKFLAKNVALVIGANHKSKILDFIDNNTSAECLAEDTCKRKNAIFEELPHAKFFQKRAYIKVQDGCDKFCSYCIIPYLRGRSRSRSIESCKAEIEASSALEVVITGIDLSSYDDNGRDLADLLFALKDCPKRIRLSSIEVNSITDKLLQVVKNMKNFAPHFHLSLQSGSNTILKKMRRKYCREDFIVAVKKIREVLPNAAITTDIIVGFPYETEENFLETLQLVQEVKFSQIHCFAYSKREGTIAAQWQDLDNKTKKERLKKLLQLSKEMQREYEAQFIGKLLQFIPEEVQDGYSVGYSENYIRLYLKGEHLLPSTVMAVETFQNGLLVEECK